MEKANAQPRSGIILCAVLSLIAGGLIGFFTPHPGQPPVDVITPDPTATPSPTPTPAPLRVYVCGAVVDPAVYTLPFGSLVDDAVRAAGGPAADADLEQINLAQVLSDQQQVRVPRFGEAAGLEPTSGSSSAPPNAAAVNINTATAAELEALPGIGPATAQSIVDYRETYGRFESIEEIMDVPGIGPSTFEEIQSVIAID